LGAVGMPGLDRSVHRTSLLDVSRLAGGFVGAARRGLTGYRELARPCRGPGCPRYSSPVDWREVGIRLYRRKERSQKLMAAGHRLWPSPLLSSNLMPLSAAGNGSSSQDHVGSAIGDVPGFGREVIPYCAARHSGTVPGISYCPTVGAILEGGPRPGTPHVSWRSRRWQVGGSVRRQ
jgi:hypothetical protein